MFKVGQKVVCIYDYRAHYEAYKGPRPDVKFPQKGEILTISSIEAAREDARKNTNAEWFISLSELGPPWQGTFDVRAFRPIVERKTDISIFQRICADVTAGKVKEVSGAHPVSAE